MSGDSKRDTRSPADAAGSPLPKGCDTSSCSGSSCAGNSSCDRVAAGNAATGNAATGNAAGGSSVLQKRFRPNANWRCGYQAAGMACSEGPTADGKCCQLVKQPEDTSVSSCTENCSCVDQCDLASLRAHPKLPSHLDLGPCVPIRSHWYSRRNISINLAILTGGLLLLSMALPGREQAFVPGGLSTKHSQILNNRLVEDRCSLCHANPHGKFAGTTQDSLCMNCHQSHMPDAIMRSAHDLPKGTLISLRSQKELTQGLWQTHCASCHSEHHGESQDLKKLSDARCQACHEKQFASLVDGHAEFSNYPYGTHRTIAFDHNSHAMKHFVKDGKEFQCSQCHSPSNGSSVGITRGVDYETGCASCHDQSLRSTSLDGWAVLTLPSIEPSDAQTDNLASWPESARFGYEGIVSIPMRFLLSAEYKSISALPTGGDLSRLPVDRKRDQTLLVAKASKTFIAKVAKEGQAFWKQQLTKKLVQRLGRELNAHEQKVIAKLTQGISPDLFRQMNGRWFQSEQLASLRQKDTPEQANNSLVTHMNSPPTSRRVGAELDSEMPPLSADAHVGTGGWFVDDEFLTLNYVPTGHGDATIAAWIEYTLLMSGNEVGQGSMPAEWLASDSLLRACIECHQGSHRKDASQLAFDWKSVGRPVGVTTFTKFNHGPHLKLPAVNQCSYCHQLKSSSHAATVGEFNQVSNVFVANESDTDSASASPLAQASEGHDFLDIHLNQCTACHRKGAAPSNCTTCHNYHVGSEGFRWSRRDFADYLETNGQH